MRFEIPSQLAALGHPKRLAIFRLLMRRYPDAVPAGEVGAALGVKPSTLSSYLGVLMQAGFIAQQREGTTLRYRLDLDTVRATFDYLFLDCCQGRPDLCSPLDIQGCDGGGKGARPRHKTKRNVLFVCTGNSARSIFAESLLRSEAPDRFDVYSAGTRPYPKLNPFAVEMLRDKGHDTDLLRPKTIAEFSGPEAPEMDFVFTVCDSAANEECPPWDGQPITAHWSTPDPVGAEGTDAERRLAFQQAYGMLRNRIRAFAALPLDQLDRISIQGELDRIASQGAEDRA